MHYASVIIFCLLLGAISVHSAEEEEDVIVNLFSGPIRGEKFPKFYAFKGIQYGESPVGEKRFEPVKVYRKKWTEVKNATEFGPFCVQLSHIGYTEAANVQGEEDCLFLNVWTSSLDSEKKLPVFIYIHGGAFMFGSGSSFTPERVVENQEMVFVTINYRVGAMGFLSTEDEVVPGNMGLKDQVVALQWVKENIHFFGGNPNSVTLTGLSAGGASTHLHYFSPLSRGLFHRGVSQSGCALNPWVLAENSRNKAMAVAAHLECPTGNAKKMIMCLKKKPAEEVVRSAKLFFPWLYNPFSPFGVVVEKSGSLPFLTEHPEVLLRTGKINHLPWVVSLTDAEGLYPVADFVNPPSRLDELNSRWEELAPAVMDYAGTVALKDQPSVAKFIRKVYFETENISEENLEKVVKMVGDRLFDAGISLSARLHAEFAKAPVYLIHFTYPSLFGLQRVFAPSYKFKGAGHAEENMIIYKTPLRKLPLGTHEKIMVQLYSEFFISVTKGKPQFGEMPLIPVTTNKRMPYLLIKSHKDFTIEITDGFGNEDFWKTLPIHETPKGNDFTKTEL
ncbi:venom carboxylesterase-6-like [Phlebotomus argentipes]|uniref:venom carboxylesterase-6-like n=1 Tax=Phlebotomus argentipes TaxID=94469 RepID=UPI00289377A1|nr:venom carboxylesterase-6-like [Phlebotomus argentipes]